MWFISSLPTVLLCLFNATESRFLLVHCQQSFLLVCATKEPVNIKVEHVLTQYFLGFSAVILHLYVVAKLEQPRPLYKRVHFFVKKCLFGHHEFEFVKSFFFKKSFALHVVKK